MIFLGWLVRGMTAVLLCAGVNGCLPSGQGDFEEEKEAHYLAGKNCLSGMDYGGAIEAFEKAAEVNPRSASAHFQLGCLYEEKVPEPAAAIYHYERFLKLRPDSDKAEFVKQRVVNCKQDLAKLVMPLPIPAGMQREFEQLAEDNKRLREDNERLRAQGAGPALVFPTNPPPPTAPRPAPDPVLGNSARVPAATDSGRAATPVRRTHVVRAGETPMAIARRYGVKLDDLLRANPGLDPRRMPVGKKLNLPPG